MYLPLVEATAFKLCSIQPGVFVAANKPWEGE